MKVSNQVHQGRPWRVHTLAGDFTLLDVSLIPIDAEAQDTFAEFFQVFLDNGGKTDSAIGNGLFALRLWLGKVFKLDDATVPLPIPGCTETTLTARLTDADRSKQLPLSGAPALFSPVYRFEHEALLEISNSTIHALLHLGWVEGEGGRRQVELAVYVKSRGLLSDAYMALIKPFRHTLVYPPMISKLVSQWKARAPAENHRRSERSSQIPEALRRVAILGPNGEQADGTVINLSGVGARVDVDLGPALAGLKKGDELAIRSGELQLAAMVVYVAMKDVTSLGLYFHKPHDQNVLARLLARS